MRRFKIEWREGEEQPRFVPKVDWYDYTKKPRYRFILENGHKLTPLNEKAFVRVFNSNCIPDKMLWSSTVINRKRYRQSNRIYYAD